MSKYYTRSGDDGSTRIISGEKILKDSKIINAIGDVDELNSSIGIAIFYVRDDPQIRSELKGIQNTLFSIGAVLASSLNKMEPGKFIVEKEDIERLEESIDRMNGKLPELKKFVLPGGSEPSAHLHLSRSLARRAERSIVGAAGEFKIDENVIKYINRLSSYLFVAALYINFVNGIDESNPIYKKD